MKALLLSAVLLGGCLRSTEFHCIDSTQCGGGVCQAVGFCSFEDSGCPSGQRFGESAGSYAGKCADGGGGDDGGVEDAPVIDDAMADAPIDMAPACPATYAVVTGAPANRVYRFINTAASWNAQRTACAADGANAYLAIPDDAAELMAINTLVPGGDWWIGVTDSATEGTYLNVKGDPQTFLPWDMGQPNNINNADCVEVHQNNRAWNDTSCQTSSRAICECEQ
ncbi:MAG: C-type lectin domain-containing protein [Kofleriaceae bacterium]